MYVLPLQDISCTNDLLPFTSTRSVLGIRMGILTLSEKWMLLLGLNGFMLNKNPSAPSLPANILPTRALAARIREEANRELFHPAGQGPFNQAAIDRIITHGRLIRYPWHIFQHNAEALLEDFELITTGRESQPIPPSVRAINPEAIFIEAGANVQHCVLNASTGPIYIGPKAEIMEGSLVRGPFAACEGATVKMGAKIYGATTLGPYSTGGGEIKNTVFFGYSNKGHDGYLGDAVIGEWCNLGAGTSASNLKNNAGTIRVWHPASGSYLDAGQKCGLLMGDYSRTAINTSFDSGTLTGVCCNIFGAGVPPKYIPDFSWGHNGSVRYEWDKAIRDIASWKKMKNQIFTDSQVLRLKHIFESL
ncbi:glucose-1-phosphate thymidylyltransferase [Puia dinghuensis]|uniref:Glucose-1-phosphate thymidylyltransferase n=2 Tax=Puia dinghuensis TaxID=1792502 RepID=A0A8J2U8E9_9BACT|nr:glucose-1-phosphate thymidylyltransferase [Puia dinghuensis]